MSSKLYPGKKIYFLLFYCSIDGTVAHGTVAHGTVAHGATE